MYTWLRQISYFSKIIRFNFFLRNPFGMIPQRRRLLLVMIRYVYKYQHQTQTSSVFTIFTFNKNVS